MTDEGPPTAGASPQADAKPGGSGQLMRVLAWLLLLLGCVWTLFAGGCTLLIASFALLQGGGSSTNGLPGLLSIGALATAPGVLMIWGGIAILRGQRLQR